VQYNQTITGTMTAIITTAAIKPAKPEVFTNSVLDVNNESAYEEE